MLHLKFGAVPNHDRTGPVLDGTVSVEGVELESHRHTPPDLFRMVAQTDQFDLAEMSASTYFAMSSRGDTRYIALPIFPARAFRHGSVVVNQLTGVSAPQDLRGKRIGMSDYQMTASLWIRAMLWDEHGVNPRDVEWYEGGLNAYRAPRLEFDLPEWLSLQRIGSDVTLNQLLVRGELNAVIDARLPAGLFDGSPGISRLFPDYRSVEEDYLRRTGFFPIMHLVVVRRELCDREPWLAPAIYDIFEAARKAGIQRLWDTGSTACAVPWLDEELERTARAFGVARSSDEFWPYGINANRPTLEYMLDQSFAQGLSVRRMGVSELFVELG